MKQLNLLHTEQTFNSSISFNTLNRLTNIGVSRYFFKYAFFQNNGHTLFHHLL